MPFVKDRYPADWPAISRRIRERAGNRCEFCGAVNHQPHPKNGKRVVLTVAHLNHTPMDCSDDNLRALCAPCHLAYDAQHHAANAAATRRRKRIAAGQMEIPCLT